MSSRRASLALVLISGVAVACSSIASTPPQPTAEDAGGQPPAAGADAGPTADGPAPDAPPSKNPCPSPEKVAPSETPSGYLAPAKVTLRIPLDGDTAHFDFPTAQNKSVRFLFVNTEETSGTYKSAFGVEAARVVTGYLRGASEIVIALEEAAPPGSGTPALDEFNRWLGLVFVDGDLLQTRMVREGWTPYFTSFGCALPPIHAALLHAEAEANAAARGLWAPGHPADYKGLARFWLGTSGCRPNPFVAPYCP
jgi:endonuclease YncB( thermonuclease family)